MAPLADRAIQVLEQVKFRDWQFIVRERDHQVVDLSVQFEAADSVDGTIKPQRGRPWQLWPEMTDSAIVLTAWAAVEMALVHEAREDFKYKDRRIVGPHIDVEAMWQHARKLDL